MTLLALVLRMHLTMITRVSFARCKTELPMTGVPFSEGFSMSWENRGLRPLERFEGGGEASEGSL